MRERLHNWGLYLGIGIGLLFGLILIIVGFDLVPKFPDAKALRAWSMKVFPPPASTVVGKVGGETLTLADVKERQKYYNLAKSSVMDKDQTILSLYRVNSNALGRNNTLTDMVSRLAEEQIILRKAEERGLAPLAEADQAALKTLAHRFYTKYKLRCKELGLTEEQLLANFTVLKVETLLKDDVAKAITAPEAEVKAAYETLLAYEKEQFDKDPSKYLSMCSGLWKYELNYHPWGYPYRSPYTERPPELLEGVPELLGPSQNPVVVYRPAEYHLIKHLLIPMEEVVDLEVQARASKNRALFARIREKKLDDNDKTEINKIRQEVFDEFLANIKPKADEVMQKLLNGAAFDDFVSEHNDTSWIYSKCMNTDYQIGPGVESYLVYMADTVHSLGKVGDIAGPIGSQYGYHIVKWVGNLPAGPIPNEEVKDQVEAALLYDERAKAWAAALAQWREEANVEVQTGKLPEDLPSIIY